VAFQRRIFEQLRERIGICALGFVGILKTQGYVLYQRLHGQATRFLTAGALADAISDHGERGEAFVIHHRLWIVGDTRAVHDHAPRQMAKEVMVLVILSHLAGMRQSPSVYVGEPGLLHAGVSA
jgi:hypothetical protein